MEQIRIDEVGISKALQRYLEDNGYSVYKLQLQYDHKTNTFSALAQVEEE